MSGRLNLAYGDGISLALRTKKASSYLFRVAVEGGDGAYSGPFLVDEQVMMGRLSRSHLS